MYHVIARSCESSAVTKALQIKARLQIKQPNLLTSKGITYFKKKKKKVI
jgi:hypothetical protein